MTGRPLLLMLALLLTPSLASAGTGGGGPQKKMASAPKKKVAPKNLARATRSGLGPAARPAPSRSPRPTAAEIDAVGAALRSIARGDGKMLNGRATMLTISTLLRNKQPGGVVVTPYQAPQGYGHWKGIAVTSTRKVDGRAIKRQVFFDKKGNHVATTILTADATDYTVRYYKGTSWAQTTRYGKNVMHWLPGDSKPRDGHGPVSALLSKIPFGLELRTAGLGL